MKVVHINTNDNADGAGKAAFRLHKALTKTGMESKMLVRTRVSHDDAVLKYRPPRPLPVRLGRRIKKYQIERDFSRYRRSRPEGFERFSDDRTVYGASFFDQLPQADVINLHSISDFVDFKTFFSAAPAHIPVVWTLHDMAPFTGGCHYDDGCGRYKSQCGACPQLGSTDSQDLSHKVWQRKRAGYGVARHSVHIVTLCEWMAGEVRSSTLLKDFPIDVIPNAVNLEHFRPRDQKFSRQVLGIPEHANVMLFVAGSLKTVRKGYHLLADIIGHISGVPDLFLLSLGSGKALRSDIPSRHLGFVTNERLLSMIYSAADIFVVPSKQDNLPNTILEAIACGTPVAGFDVGGIPEIVQPGKNGVLASDGDVKQLGSLLSSYFQDTGGRGQQRTNARKMAEEKYSMPQQAEKYRLLYERLQDQKFR